jgi:hypothetical protein
MEASACGEQQVAVPKPFFNFYQFKQFWKAFLFYHQLRRHNPYPLAAADLNILKTALIINI